MVKIFQGHYALTSPPNNQNVTVQRLQFPPLTIHVPLIRIFNVHVIGAPQIVPEASILRRYLIFGLIVLNRYDQWQPVQYRRLPRPMDKIVMDCFVYKPVKADWQFVAESKLL